MSSKINITTTPPPPNLPPYKNIKELNGFRTNSVYSLVNSDLALISSQSVLDSDDVEVMWSDMTWLCFSPNSVYSLVNSDLTVFSVVFINGNLEMAMSIMWSK